MDGKSPYNSGSIVFSLRIEGHGKLMGYLIMMPFKLFKKPHPLVS